MLQNEVQAVQRQRKTLADDVQTETNRLILLRRNELAEVEALSAKRLQEIQHQIKTEQTTLIHVSRQKLEIQAQLAALEASVAPLEDRQRSLEQAARIAANELEVSERRKVAAEARLTFIEAGIPPLVDQQVQLEAEIAECEQVKEQLILRNVQLENGYTNRMAEIELEISNLLGKQQELEVAQAGMYQQYQQMSEAIAAREKASDEREMILKRREAKVAQDERTVARNASLLTL